MPVRTLNSVAKNKEYSPEADTDTESVANEVINKPVRKQKVNAANPEPVAVAPANPVVERKKREISDEQKEVLRKRLEIARQVRKQQADEKRKIEEMLLKEKEKEVSQKIINKVQKLSKKNEVKALKKYVQEEEEDEVSEEEYVPPVKPQRRQVVKQPQQQPRQQCVAPQAPVPPPIRFL